MLIERDLESTLLRLAKRKEILIIRGPRQAGKTTLMKTLEEKIDSGIRKTFINMDLASFRKEFESDPIEFAKRFANKPIGVLFIDEVQRCSNAGEGLKLIYDTEKPKIITSGSSSLELKVNILPYLVGRAFTFDLLTFSFGEFLKSKDHSLARIFYEKNNSVKAFIAEGKEIGKPSFAAELANHFKEYAVFGGYPEAVMAPRDEKTLVIDSLRSTYLEKDVAAFFHVYDTSKFEDFVKVLAFQTANVLSVSVVAKELGIGLKKAEEFLEILQHTYLVRLLRPFHRNLSTEVRKSRKVYFLDLGLRNSVMGNFIEFDKREDQGKLLENFVFRELTASFGDWEIRYWRTTAKAEVDFVLMKGDQIVPIEVKAGGKPGKSFYSFCQTYKPKRAVIVTLDRFEKAKIGNTTVYYVPAFYL